MLLNLFKSFAIKHVARKPHSVLNSISPQIRSYADTSKPDAVNPKQLVVQGATENEERVRVRRARPADVPRVLRFVRDHAKTAWPGLIVPPSVSHIVLCDYVARALSQGHSMLAEQPEPRRGWSNIRGLALNTSVCPWDAAILEKWAKCVRCPRSRRLMHFTAHCLRAPALHDKYRVHNILQVVLVIPKDTTKATEIIQILARNSIQRARDVGFPLLRFDVTDEIIAKTLEEMNLKKEWELSFDLYPGALKELAAADLIMRPAKKQPSIINATKFDAAAANSAKVDAAKFDTVKVEATKGDAAKVDAVKFDAAVKVAKVDDPNIDAAKIGAAKLDDIKLDSTKIDATKVDAAKLDVTIEEPTKDATKRDVTKDDATNEDAPKFHAAKDNITTVKSPPAEQQEPAKPKTIFEGNFITVYTAFPQAEK